VLFAAASRNTFEQTPRLMTALENRLLPSTLGIVRWRGPVSSVSAWLLAACVSGALGCQSGEVEKTKAAASTATPEPPPKPALPPKPAPPPEPAGLPAPADVAAPPETATKTASGLASVVLQPGTGKEHPTTADRVKVHYTGWTKDGKMFDSSVPRNKPTEFGVTQVIKGWTEGLQLMVVGEKRRFWIPAAIAYGDTPRRPGAPSGQLTFDVELLEVMKPLPPPEVPKDVAKAPASAKKTASGLQYRVLKAGTGTVHPTPTSRVQVHYSGWTPDGKMFDSSVARGTPAGFGLNQVIKGWTEGVQLMVVGEKTRFWIPGELAYGKDPARPGAPGGPLVFDVELLSIDK
jgi:FKBP-type peptidyl-prolyl cis-trans isomerase